MDDCLWCSALTSVFKTTMTLNQSHTPLSMTNVYESTDGPSVPEGLGFYKLTKLLRFKAFMAKITNGFLCGVTQSQNVPMSLSFILMREWMREKQNEIDCEWARISTFVLYRDSIVYPKLHYLLNLKGTFSSLSSLKKYFYHLSRAQVQHII